MSKAGFFVITLAERSGAELSFGDNSCITHALLIILSAPKKGDEIIRKK